MTSDYKTSAQLDWTESRLSARDRRVIEVVERLGLASGAQLRRLYFETDGTGRSDGQVCRRALLRLTRLGVLARLERRIGGVKSGSDNFCYRTGPVGQRLVRRWFERPETRGRNRPEPGERFVAHRLAVAEILVGLVESCRAATERDVIEFKTEPDCWRPYVGRQGNRQLLKPDAFARLGVGDQELWWFIEADLGSVSQRTRSDQADAYRAYWRSGAAGNVMPRVLWCCRDDAVAQRAKQSLGIDEEPAGLFVITTLGEAARTATEARP